MSDSVGAATGFDVIIAAPGAQQALDAAATGLRAVGSAAVQSAESVDANNAAMKAATSTADELARAQAQQSASVRQGATAVQELTASQRALAEAGVSLEQVLAAVDGQTKQATGSAREDVAARKEVAQAMREQVALGQSMANEIAREREMLLLHSKALEENAAMASVNAAATEEAAAATGVHGLQLGRINMELGTAVGRFAGVNTAVTRFGAMLGGSLAGYGQMIAVLVVLAALAKAYEAVTASSREAAKAADEFAKGESGRAAINTGLGAAGDSHTRDFAAVSAEAEKAAKAAANYRGQLDGLTTSANAALAPVRDLARGLLTGSVTSEDFTAGILRLKQTDVGKFFGDQLNTLARVGSLYEANRDALDRYNASVQQALAVQRFYTTTLQASSTNEGQLLEQITQRESVLAAYQSGGKPAGIAAEGSASAFNAARQMYEDYAKSGKDATLATVAFQDALKAHNPIAEAFLAEQKKLVDVNQAITHVQQQATSGMADANKLTAFTDQIARLAQEADEFGKDASIDNRIKGIDDQLNHFTDSLQQQLATGKLSKASFDAQGASVETLRQHLYEVGDALKQAYNDQITKEIHEQYLASKQLADAVVDGTGAYHELTAAKAAQLEIDAKARAIGHDLTDDQQAEIRAKHTADAVVQGAQYVQALRNEADAMEKENAVALQGADAQARYTIAKQYDLAVSKAQTLASDDQREAAVAAAARIRDAAVAHLTAAEAQKAEAQATISLTAENRKLADSFEKDLFSAIEQFSTRGAKSFESFATEVERLAFRMAGQLQQALEKAYAANDAEAIDHFSALKGAAQAAGTVIGAGIGGYNIGLQSGNTTTGALGGAAQGAAMGAALGPWGAAVGGLVGAAGGLLGAAAAHKAAAEALRKAAEQTHLQLTQFNAAAGSGSGMTANLESGHLQANALFDAIDAALPGLKNQAERERELAQVRKDEAAIAAKLATDFETGLTQQLNALHGTAGALANQLASLDDAYTQNIASINALQAAGLISAAQQADEAAQAKHIHDEAAAQAQQAYDDQQNKLKQDIAARALAAGGGSDKAVSDMQFALQQERELADLRKQTTDPAIIAAEQAVLAAEKAKREADWQQLNTDKQADAQVRLLRATGHADEADMLALELQQQREYNDAVQQGLDDATLAALKLADAAEQAQLAAQQAAAAMQKMVSGIKQDQSVLGLSNDETLAREAAALGFAGLTIDEIKAQYIAHDHKLTDDQEALDARISQYLQDYASAHGGGAGAGVGQGDLSHVANSQVQNDITSLTEGTGSRMADFLSSINLHVASIDTFFTGNGDSVYRGSLSALQPIGAGAQTFGNITVNFGNVYLTDGSQVPAASGQLTTLVANALRNQLKRDRLALSPSR